MGAGCGPDDAGDTAADTGGSGGESTATATGSGSASASESTSASASLSDTGTDGPTSTADTGTATTEGGTPADSGTGATDTTAGADHCVGLDRVACNEDITCAPIACGPIVMGMNGAAELCIDEAEFIGCQAADIPCPEVRTFTCMGDDGPIYACPNGCIPADWMTCEPPPIDLMPC